MSNGAQPEPGLPRRLSMWITRPVEALMERVEFGPGSPAERCWLWARAVNTSGYGLVEFRGQRQAHRLAYELFVGPIPPGWRVDHTCEVKRCVRPFHLEAVTARENSRRYWARRRAGPHDETAQPGPHGVRGDQPEQEPA